MNPFDADSDVIVINEVPAEFAPKFASRGRGVGSAAKRRVTIEITSQPLLHQFDENMLGAKPAEAIRNVISKAIKNIGAFASEATRLKRQRALEALSRGASWAVKRYSGGRTGTKFPNQSSRLFNDSERFAEGLFVRQNPTDKTYTVNVPANRLDPREFTESQFQAMLDKLRSLVPILGDGRKLLQEADVRKAISESINDLIVKGDSRRMESLKALAAARRQAVREIIRLLETVAGA